jgi:hypothetical protein
VGDIRPWGPGDGLRTMGWTPIHDDSRVTPGWDQAATREAAHQQGVHSHDYGSRPPAREAGGYQQRNAEATAKAAKPRTR